MKNLKLKLTNCIFLFLMLFFMVCPNYGQTKTNDPVFQIKIRNGKIVESKQLIGSNQAVIPNVSNDQVKQAPLYKYPLQISLPKGAKFYKDPKDSSKLRTSIENPDSAIFDSNKLLLKVKTIYLPKQSTIESLQLGATTTTIMLQGFEGIWPGTTGWRVNTNGSTDTYWDDISYRSYSGSYSAWCAAGGTNSSTAGGTYKNNMNAWMVYGPFDLSDATTASLNYKLWYSTELNYDKISCYASLNGTNYYGLTNSGSSGGWVSKIFDLTNVYTLGNLCGKSQVWIAFNFTSDLSNVFEGAYIDDVLLQKTVTTLPDLQATSIALSSESWVVDSSITANLTEKNAGDAMAGSHYSQLYLSPTTNISVDGTPLGSPIYFSSIASGSTQSNPCSFEVPEISDGTYYVGVIVDINNNVTESNEANNIVYRNGKVSIAHPELFPAISVAPTIFTIDQTDFNSIKANSLKKVVEDKPVYVPLLPDSLHVSTIIDNNGNKIDIIKIGGTPPSVYRAEVASISANAVTLNNVPAFDWSFGCSSTSAAMIAGYYDNNGYPNVYTGPTNGGIMPMTNESWGAVVINGETRSQCPLSATRMGVDGRIIRGHVDDYWVKYGNEEQDPFKTGGWEQHVYGDCTGDFMKTNQSDFNNTDGSTHFYFNLDGSPFSGKENKDGGYGFELFFKSKGYTVTNRYNQYIQGYNGNTKGFTFSQFVSEIDAGRPVLIQVTNHTMVGYGYDLNGNIVYIHDTWDHSNHSMTWGGSYSGLSHYGVSVFQLAPNVTNNLFTITNTGQANLTVSSMSVNKSWLSFSPSSVPVYLAAGQSSTYSLTVDWDLVSASTDTATISILSNDPNNSIVMVTITANKTMTIPTISTNIITAITSSTATSGGAISSDGGANVTSRGVCWSLSPNPTIAGNKTVDGSDIGSFVSNISGLSGNKTYHVRAYATNSVGTAYGEDVAFDTPSDAVLPTVYTSAITAITSSAATSGGVISSDGGANVTSRGVCWSLSPNPTIAGNKTADGSDVGSFVSSISGLSGNKKYHIRAYATNLVGTAYGEDIVFDTPSDVVLPTVLTSAVSAITYSTVICGGVVADDGGGTIIDRGVCWDISPNPTITNTNTKDGSGKGAFASSITGLSSNKMYHVRAYATNAAGTAYGTDISFTTILSETKNITNSAFEIYPNPTYDEFHITRVSGKIMLSLYDMNGSLLLTKNVTANENISVYSLPQGLYILRIITNEGTLERKLVKK